jgi:hypothetical protein
MASPRPNESRAESPVQQRVAATLAQARQHLIRNNSKAAVALLKETAALPDCPVELRLEAAKMLGTAGAQADAAMCYLAAGLALLYDQGDIARARQAFASAHNLDPQNLEVIFHLGQADVVEGRTQDGLAKFIDVLRKSNLKHTPALFEAGCIYQANGQYDQAILAFKKVLDRERNHIQAIVHMGQLHQIKGMIPEAIGYYLQAAQSTRESNQLGTTRQIVNMVLAIDANNPRARSMLNDLDEKPEEEEAAAESTTLPEPVSPTLAPLTDVAQAQAASAPLEPAMGAQSSQFTAPPKAPAAGIQAAADLVVARAAASQAAADQAAAGAEVERLAHERDEVAEQLARLRSELAEARRQKESQEAEALKSAQASRAEAEHERESARVEMERDRAQLDAERAQLEAQLADLRNQIAAAEETAAAQAKSATAALELERKSKSLAAHLAAEEKTRVQLEARLSELRQQITSAEQAAAQRARDAAAAEELARKSKELAAQVAAEEKRLDETRAQAVQLQNELAKAQTAHEAAMLELAARRKRAQAELEKLQSEAHEATQARDAQRTRAELSVAELDAKSAQLRKEVAAADTRRAEAERKAADAEKQLAQLLAKLEQTKGKAETAAADLRDIVDQSRTAQATHADLGSKLAELQAAITAAEGRKRVLEDSIGKVKPLAAAAEKRRSEAESKALAAEQAYEKQRAALLALETSKRELEESYANTKSLIASAERKRAEAEAAAEKAEALRAKREADAAALAARVGELEGALRSAEARAKAANAEGAALAELSEKVNEQRSLVLELETKKAQTQAELAKLAEQLTAMRREVEETQASLGAAAQLQAKQVQIDAEAIAVSVSPESCADSLRTIEQLAADGELPIEIATELAGLIHEGRASQALVAARTRANLEAAPAPYLLVSGDLARDLGDITAAREAYKMLAAADPNRAPLAQSRTSDLFLAFAQASTAAALARDDAHFAAVTDPQKAIETYAELVARFPDDPTFREELGALHEQLGNAAAAALAYTRALVDYLGGDDVAHALELAPKLLALEPHNGAAHELAARAYERAGRKTEAKAALDEALHCYRQAALGSEVERVCRRLVELADDPVPYRCELAKLLQDAGDDAGAAEQLLEGAEKLIGWSRGLEAAELLDQAEALSEQDGDARERIKAMRAKAADVARSVDDVALGDLLVSKRDFGRAAHAYRRALEENPHDATAAYQLACLLMDHMQDDEAAEKLLETASQMRPEHTATRFRLALVKAARGQVVEAVELLIAMARFDESNADFIEQFAERLENEAQSGDVAAKYRLGIAYRELGRIDEALVILQSIQREHDYVVLCHNAIGLCLRRQGLDTAAAKRFSKAIETPGYPEVQYHEALYNLGELYEAKDTPESLANALSSFEELYASDCTFKDVGDRIKAVKARMGASERPKVKRLPTRAADRP